MLLDASVFHFPELNQHKLNQKWYGPLRVIKADSETLTVRTPMDKDFHARVHVSACKLYVRDAEHQLPQLPDSQVDDENWEIRAVVGHRWTQSPRRKEFRVRFMHAPHNVPEHDEWFAASDLSATKLVKEYNKLLKQGYSFADGLVLAKGQPHPPELRTRRRGA